MVQEHLQDTMGNPDIGDDPKNAIDRKHRDPDIYDDYAMHDKNCFEKLHHLFRPRRLWKVATPYHTIHSLHTPRDRFMRHYLDDFVVLILRTNTRKTNLSILEILNIFLIALRYRGVMVYSSLT